MVKIWSGDSVSRHSSLCSEGAVACDESIMGFFECLILQEWDGSTEFFSAILLHGELSTE